MGTAPSPGLLAPGGLGCAATALSLLCYYLFSERAILAAEGVNRVWQGDSTGGERFCSVCEQFCLFVCFFHFPSLRALGTLSPPAVDARVGGSASQAAGESDPAL